MSLPVRIRDASADDWPFIRKAWRESFMRAPAVQGAGRQLYFEEMTRLFAAIAPTASARVASHPSDDDTRLGFACYAGSTLYYAYVLQDFRGNGIVPMMLEGLPIRHFSFKTIQGERRLKPLKRDWVFKPCFTYGSG